jgi:hypothetical protein
MAYESTTLILIECVVPILAFVVGAYTFSKLNRFYKLIFLQGVFYLITISGAYAVTFYQTENNLPPNNQWFYNLCFPVECAILASAAIVYFSTKKATIRILTGYGLFFAVYLFQISITGISGFANYAVVMEALLMVIVYLVILYECFKDESFDWKTSPEFWLCLGMAVYFGCIVPYFSIINYLWQHNSDLTETLFEIIIHGFGNMRYFLIAISFWLFFRQQRISLVNKTA